MPQGRPAIPEETKRLLRQEARFGCCACGAPVYEHQHIIPWAVAREHDPENMMILCPNHHQMCTQEAVTEEQQRAWKAKPFNVQRGYAHGLLQVNHDYCAVRCGSCLFVNDGVVVLVDDEPIVELGVEDDRAVLSLTLCDEDDNVLALIDRNEWVGGDPTVWDLQAGFQQLTIRRGPGQTSFRLDVRHEPFDLRARLWRRGFFIEMSPSALKMGAADGRRADGSLIGAAMVNMIVDIHTSGQGTIALKPDPFHGGDGVFLTATDPVKQLADGINKLQELRMARTT